ncbi:hemerythrin domain-containing protein [Rhodoplanes sp. TEM]|uniref:Hemerythrin domain-containing protein n=1 Tax=Rhodoplanes tepidamans TaxID=200616 RepID=A0ABT5J3Q9_RHOTP|nr:MULTISPECIES: hemerythrin domain-containing protein [Rhodoplanes]MDC7784087.1 hemerythrin domain-containing protein [Rhodoplanes tepidamans]MDC7983182.1 hemerythrin domain-containing protein [Rhodoplanes sp. TEM]MDQ0356816.1 hemerythrin-like domain-containing protein [Rhodoplanes tepidamans]
MKAIDIIRDEHRALAAVLRAMEFTVAGVRAGRFAPDFRLFAMLVDYIVRVPEESHHPKEDEVLFPLVRAACPEVEPILDELEAQHQAGEAHIQELGMALIHWQAVGDPGFERFAEVVGRYLSFEWAHIELEESRLLPLLEARLAPAARAAVDAAFAANADPWRGRDGEFDTLFSAIVAATPAPMGLGGPAGRG